jgi:hypothetical protein
MMAFTERDEVAQKTYAEFGVGSYPLVFTLECRRAPDGGHVMSIEKAPDQPRPSYELIATILREMADEVLPPRVLGKLADSMDANEAKG